MAIGVIGLGTMGGRIVRALLEAGHEVVVYDASDEALTRATDAGARAVGSVGETPPLCRVVLLSLPRPGDVVEVVAGADGLLSRSSQGFVVADTSTVDPGTTRRMADMAAEAGAGYLDAPILGRPEACGRWTLPVGGNREDLEVALPALDTIARNVSHVGASGSGNAIKLLNNLMFGAINAITAEALAAAALVGLSPRTFYETVAQSDAATVSNLFRAIGPKMLEGDFSPAFTVDLLSKDNSLALAMIEDAGASVIVGNAVETLNGLARAAGYGHEDTSATVKVYEQLLGVTVGDHADAHEGG
ncbi:MAG TPA: NAD(P)-dependent oxidoreductase [Rubrobacter sp.]|nr:NAD(P)-dependent oxidoreductase [Rubrobacter sp.]